MALTKFPRVKVIVDDKFYKTSKKKLGEVSNKGRTLGNNNQEVKEKK